MNLLQDVDLIVVACPPSQHSQIAVKALGIGKHVAVQSPGGLNQDEAMRMVQAAQYYPRLVNGRVMTHELTHELANRKCIVNCNTDRKT